MPRLDPSGRYAVQGTGGPVSINGTVVAPRGTCAQWLDDYRVIYQAGRDDVWTIETCDVRNGEIQTVSDQGANELAAGGGRWAAMLGSKGGVYGSLGFLAGAGVSPTGTDGRGAAGRDGTLAIVPNRQTGASMELWAPDWHVTEIRPAAYGLRVIGPGQAVWNGGSIGIPTPQRLPGGQNGVRVTAPDGRIWWVEWLDQNGLVAYLDGSSFGHVIAPLAFHHDAVVTPAGELTVAYSLGVGESPEDLVRVENVWALPSKDLTPPVEVPRLGRACWLGFFAGSLTGIGTWYSEIPAWTLPGNCYLSVPDDLKVYSMTGSLAAVYVAAEQDGTVEGLEAAVRAARKWERPVIAYWPRSLQGGRTPVCDYLGVELYPRPWETPAAAEARWRALLATIPAGQPIIEIAAAYDAPDDVLEALVPVYVRLARDARVIGILVFNGTGRAGGLQNRPRVRDAWQKAADGIPETPPIQIIHLPPPPPIDPPPPPVDPPIDPPPVHEEIDMPLWDDPKFQSACKETAQIVAGPWGLKPVDVEQGARELGDEMRRPKNSGGQFERNPTAIELALGYALRSGGKVPHEKFVALLPELGAFQERLRS